ncbi:universal stress protein [Methylobacterium nonmethylotrophicum]|uniref:Universal stress protein n=1 Tax=Methylobacterium nonmethylotrophicum TaxID=1141884 RepID=A0A4Z0NJH5_9HYPH|nr:universal stress protein [Methylobacterium nonmethylotrophicum]TGD95852.1 universal stress protein [Methylobacterium nonmethylotrophicum]
MKTLLVPVARHTLLDSVLDTAVLTARRFGASIEGFGLRPALAEYVPVDMVGGMTWVRDEETDLVEARDCGGLFAAAMERHGIARDSADIGKNGPRWRWLPDAAPGDGFLAQHARLFAATVVGRPGSGENAPRMTTLEAVLFESGRPLVIAPPTAPASIGETVVIAWNGSTETARAVAFAAPFLRAATRIEVLGVDAGMVPGPSAEELAAALNREGLSAQGRTLAAGRRTAGEIFLTEAEAIGCDLLVKGAYTQSRLRQMIFGGATSHILAHATMPVLMAH